MKKSKVECENISFKYDESRRWSNSISILVVDDDTTCLSFVAALLKKLKYEGMDIDIDIDDDRSN